MFWTKHIPGSAPVYNSLQPTLFFVMKAQENGYSSKIWGSSISRFLQPLATSYC